MDFDNHPCFNPKLRHSTGRIHLPVAPACNVQCNFCDRKFDCVGESRPGVSSAVLSPEAAVDYLGKVLERVPNISVVGIAGPGDPFANAEQTLRTMELVSERYPDKILCLATNGVALAEHVDAIARMRVSHVTVTVNAVDPAIAAKVYAWVRFGARVYRGLDAGNLVVARQEEAIRRLKEAGMTVKVNTVVVPGVNDAHVGAIAERVSSLGADVQNCIALMNVEGTPFASIAPPDAGKIGAIRLDAGRHIRQMSHCARCRADAVGLLGEENGAIVDALLSEAKGGKPTADRRYVAVASREGILVNQHLGEATGLWVFGPAEGGYALVDRRPTPVPGDGDDRWEAMADRYSDCFAILCSGFGPSPARVLESRGIRVYAMEGLIRDGAGALLAGKDIPDALVKAGSACGRGLGCTGTGLGCA